MAFSEANVVHDVHGVSCGQGFKRHQATRATMLPCMMIEAPNESGILTVTATQLAT